mmetsp:Transcript_6342/g.25559  ORF Transcript_6342/g.25559 Transcript_6342/m.25559 type:complete len:206 (-) Transcript_6342:556-1173(-)
MAATRRGCVQMTFTGLPDSAPSSRRNWATCVVLPQPVSPRRMEMSLSSVWRIIFLWWATGSEWRCFACGPPPRTRGGGGGGATWSRGRMRRSFLPPGPPGCPAPLPRSLPLSPLLPRACVCAACASAARALCSASMETSTLRSGASASIDERDIIARPPPEPLRAPMPFPAPGGGPPPPPLARMSVGMPPPGPLVSTLLKPIEVA